MNSFLNLITTSEWWLSVVIVGILINLFSNFLTPLLQAKFAHLSRRWGERNEKLAKQRAARIEELASSDHELYLAYFNLTRLRLDGIYCFVGAVGCLGFGIVFKDFAPWSYTIFIIFAMLSVLEGTRMTVEHGQEWLLITEAKYINLSRKREFTRASA